MLGTLTARNVAVTVGNDTADDEEHSAVRARALRETAQQTYQSERLQRSEALSAIAEWSPARSPCGGKDLEAACQSHLG